MTFRFMRLERESAEARDLNFNGFWPDFVMEDSELFIMDPSLKQKQLYFIHDQLKDLHSKLDHEVQSTIPLDHLLTIAIIINDDPNIFEIVKSLRELQNTKENLLKEQRDEQVLAHQLEIEGYIKTLTESELAHTVALAKMQHEKRMAEIDKNIVRELDKTVAEQQNTLAALRIPGFYETSDKKKIITQCHLLRFILRVQKILENPQDLARY